MFVVLGSGAVLVISSAGFLPRAGRAIVFALRSKLPSPRLPISARDKDVEMLRDELAVDSPQKYVVVIGQKGT